MIDGIALKVTLPSVRLLGIDKLDTRLTLERKRNKSDTGHRLRWRIAGLTFTAWILDQQPDEADLEIRGSVHRLANAGLTNGGKLTEEGLRLAASSLATLLGMEATDINLKSVEFGYNVRTRYPAADSLNHLVAHREMPFTERYRGAMLRLDRDKYSVKVYDKGKQLRNVYNIPDATDGHTLRVEIKMEGYYLRKVKKVGASKLADLLRPQIADKLNELLLVTVRSLTWYAAIDYGNTPSAVTEREVWTDYTKAERRAISGIRKRLEAKYLTHDYKSEVLALLTEAMDTRPESVYAKGGNRVHIQSRNPLDYLQAGYTHKLDSEEARLLLIQDLKASKGKGSTYRIDWQIPTPQ